MMTGIVRVDLAQWVDPSDPFRLPPEGTVVKISW
jgi:hypothetical protein